MTNSLQKLELAVPMGSLESYINWAHQTPLLTQEEEIELAVHFAKTGDLESARRMVMSHMRYVISVARGYLGYGLGLGDLVQEGAIGLMKAVKRFDPAKGVRLVSFASHWIKAEIHEFILRNWRIVKVATTKAQRKLFFNLRKANKERDWLSTSEVKGLADKHDVKVGEVSRMEERLHGRDVAFDSASNDDEDWAAPTNFIECRKFDPARAAESDDWSQSREQSLHTALAALDPRSLDILQHRWLNDDKMTLHELADKYEVSAERIRQLEKNAMLKVKTALEEAA
jgi:RNA polymerase sigma-32 factor